MWWRVDTVGGNSGRIRGSPRTTGQLSSIHEMAPLDAFVSVSCPAFSMSGPRTTPLMLEHRAKRITTTNGLAQNVSIVKRRQIECRNTLLMRKNASKTAFYLSICKTDTNRSIL